MADEIVCRFCLLETESVQDPFITPCACIGSVKYVHTNCLKKWRRLTTCEAHKTFCQICHTGYNLPRLWPLEKVPVFVSPYWWHLINPGFIIAGIYYFHLMYIMAVQPASTPASIMTPQSITHKISDPKSLYFFQFELAAISSVYLFIYTLLLLYVKNHSLYFTYFLKSNYHLVSASIAMFILSGHCVFPFGAIYITILPRYFHAHRNTILQINADGSNF